MKVQKYTSFFYVKEVFELEISTENEKQYFIKVITY
jgi:hypothetical protein